MKCIKIYETADGVRHESKEQATSHCKALAQNELVKVLQAADCLHAEAIAQRIVKNALDSEGLTSIYYSLFNTVNYLKDTRVLSD